MTDKRPSSSAIACRIARQAMAEILAKVTPVTSNYPDIQGFSNL